MRLRRVETVLLAVLVALPLVGLEGMIAAQPAGAAAVPGAPRSVSVVPQNQGAKVSWKAPLSNGGSPITAYVITPYLGTVAQPARTFLSAKTTQIVNGLKNGKSYAFKVAARNANGKGAFSAKSGTTVAGAPGKPGPAGTYIPPPNLGQIGVRSDPPARNGSNITRYNATCVSSNGGATKTGVRQKPAVDIVFLTGLTSSKRYTCTVTATNARGTGPQSNASSPFVAP